MANNLIRRGNKYSVRIYIPLDLQPLFPGAKGNPKKEIPIALHTFDPLEARRRGRAEQTKYDRIFTALRAERARASAKLPFGELELQNAIWQRYSALMESDQARRLATPTQAELNDAWSLLVEEYGEDSITAWRILESIEAIPEADARERAARLAILKMELGRGETRSVKSEIQDAITERRLAVSPRSAEERELAQGLQRAEVQALIEIAKRDEGDFSPLPFDPLVKPPNGAHPSIATAGQTLMELFDIYSGENPNRARSETLIQARRKVALFSEFLGSHFVPAKIGKKEIREWKNVLKIFPIKAVETNAFKGMNVKQIVEANKNIGKSPISGKTLNQYLTALGAFCRWLVSEGHLESNPVSDMLLKIDDDQRTVLPYSTEQLNAIFRSPLFVGCKGLTPSQASKHGNVLVRDHHYWVPLIGLFTGARSNEICQLLVKDVVQVEGHWVFDITNEGDEQQQVKNDNSKRLVPIHPELVKLGFLNYHSDRGKAKDHWLFPTAVADGARGKRNAAFGKFYGQYAKKIGVKVGSEVNFHSFRHTLTDAMRAVGILDPEIAMIVGHEKKTTTSRYGVVKHGNIERRVKIINALRYDGLDLSHLVPKATGGHRHPLS